MEFRLARDAHKQPWTAEDLSTLAQLFDRVQDINETARYYYALYSLPSAAPSYTEKALCGLAELLFTHAGQGLRFGAGDLSFYRDIATIDTSPGFFNGILSLVLNRTSPESAYAQEDQNSVAYFQRAHAAELVDLFDKRFPRSTERAALHTHLIQAYAAYGDDNAIIRFGRAFMTSFPQVPQRETVGMLMADAYARQEKVTEEFALYDQLLKELALKEHGTPLRSTEYTAVLDRYLSRLAALDRKMDALRVYRREIDRNPDDPDLYARLAGFLEQNELGKDVESTYRRAIAKFPDRVWYDRLARWYLKEKQEAQFQTLTREVVGIFSGTELEKYFGDVVAQASLDRDLSRQLNLYAHQRFPQDLTFVHNLLNLNDSSVSIPLLRQYWFYEPELKNRLFAELSSENKIYADIDALRKQNPDIAAGRAQQVTASNPAASQFSAEAEAWLCHFEAAAPEMRALAKAYPGQTSFTSRASAIYRSLAAYDPAHMETAAALAESEVRSNPRDLAALAKVGDIYADRKRFDRARVFWNRMPAVDPENSEGYLEAATVFWDYYKFSDALRIIRKARTDFDDTVLLAYEAGAIYENQRDYNRAVKEYVAGAIAGNEQAEQRLMRLSTRPKLGELIYKLTETGAPVKLRAAILDKQSRRKELESLLLEEANRASTVTALLNIAGLATAYSLDNVEERAMERRVKLTTDPVDKMRLRIDLARMYERKHEHAEAARNMGDLYRDNPLILGVVRAAVDFNVRSKQPDRALTILLDAASHARPNLANQFTQEAANVATDAGDFEPARKLLTGLLKDDPYNSEYLAAMTATWSKAGDDRGLRDYQLATIELLKKAPFSPAYRNDRIAALRRTLIPSLTRLSDFAGAVDQYIEVINHYPEDDSLEREALSYAAAHNRTAQLLAFYKKTIAEAPGDYRWPIVLGRLETYAEDYPAAISAYDLAMKDRPDRADVVQSRAQLEERLMRFDDATRSYSRLYELTYKDSQWMEKIAELNARLRQPDKVVSALRTVIIGTKAETPEADFAIAAKLESWDLIPQAVEFVERGARIPPAELAKRNDLRIYVRVMTRARRIEPVLNLLRDFERTRSLAGDIGSTIATYYAPEEKPAVERTIAAHNLEVIAAPAGLTELQARSLDVTLPLYIELQLSRGLYAELGRQLEAEAVNPKRDRMWNSLLSQAVDAYAAAGDINAELRVLRELRDRNALYGSTLERYLTLIGEKHPDELISLIEQNASYEVSNRAVQFAISGESPALALRAVPARGNKFNPVWTKAYTALTGLHFSDGSAPIRAAFASALDTRTIGERLTTKFDRDQQLAGDVWFYYGARYGEYLDLMTSSDAAGYLPATVEHAPGNPDAYLALGDYYATRNNVPKAIAEFELVLQLDSGRGDAHDHIARLLWKNTRRDEAVTHWRAALSLYRQQESSGHIGESFWSHVIETVSDIGEAKALAELRADVVRLIADYVTRNGTYRSVELIQAAFDASIDSAIDPDWLIDIAKTSDEAEGFLNALLRLPRLTDPQRIRVQRALVDELDKKREGSSQAARLALVSLLLDSGDLKGANAEWEQVSESSRDTAYEIRIRVAAANHTLPQLLESWRARDNIGADTLRQASVALRDKGDKEAARAVLEFLYRRELARGALDSANFLGLADVLLEKDDLAGAMTQLKRMVLVVADGFETLLPAADVLTEHGRKTEATEFVRKRVQAVPWDAAARLRLNPDSELPAIAANPNVPYATRCAATKMLAPQSPKALGSTELGLLAGGRIMPDLARKPFYVQARLAAAEDIADPGARLNLLLEALAIAPGNDIVRKAAVTAALDAGRDSLALAMYSVPAKGSYTALGERLAQAAERTGDLKLAADLLRAAELKEELHRIEAELARRATNAARAPVIKKVVDQDRVVRPRIARSAQ